MRIKTKNCDAHCQFFVGVGSRVKFDPRSSQLFLARRVVPSGRQREPSAAPSSAGGDAARHAKKAARNEITRIVSATARSSRPRRRFHLVFGHRFSVGRLVENASCSREFAQFAALSFFVHRRFESIFALASSCELWASGVDVALAYLQSKQIMSLDARAPFASTRNLAVARARRPRRPRRRRLEVARVGNRRRPHILRARAFFALARTKNYSRADARGLRVPLRFD